jgi:hypothetical protein
VAVIVYFTSSAPAPLTDQLILAGNQVFEALAISEVLALAEEHPGAHIIIDADVEAEQAKVVQQHYPTIQLQADATPADVLWELELLAPSSRKSIH